MQIQAIVVSILKQLPMIAVTDVVPTGLPIFIVQLDIGGYLLPARTTAASLLYNPIASDIGTNSQIKCVFSLPKW
jgi:hypothetical protein